MTPLVHCDTAVSLATSFCQRAALFAELFERSGVLLGMSTAASAAEPVHVGNVPLPTAEQLPDDPEVLKRMILELLATLQREQHDKQQLRDRLDLLLRR